MTRVPALLRPRDSDALRAELRRAAGASTTPVFFGGEVHGQALVLSEFVGTWTSGLRGLVIPPRSGLGGRVVDQKRPVSVADYQRASSITHDYDGPVGGEGITSVLGVPVVVGGVARAVLYAADRGAGPIGGRTVDCLVQSSRRLATEIAIRDEVDRRTRMWSTLQTGQVDAVLTEELRDIHADLRSITRAAGDPDMQRQLRALTDRLARTLSGESAQDETPVALSPRELDVLSHIALGCTNHEVAQRLSVGPESVKSYLRSAMRKLDAHSRHEAVVKARKSGLLA